ncbi:MAG: hypothetical protein J6Y00_02080 [Paludibacteraceae bacterium]|nr:hypothetical protein [Paludibacteraceae bacterium]
MVRTFRTHFVLSVEELCKRRKGLHVKTACELFGKTKQAYYKNKTDGEERLRREERIIDTVKQIREIAPGTGARKLWLIIKHIYRNEWTPGRDRFFGMLDARGLQLPRPKPRRTTNSNHRFRKYKNLILGFIPQSANQLWSADITYIDTEAGVCYLHVVTDSYSHEIWVGVSRIRWRPNTRWKRFRYQQRADNIFNRRPHYHLPPPPLYEDNDTELPPLALAG